MAEQRLIDAEALRQEIESKIYWGQISKDNVECLDEIDDAPTVDAVPVVRCKDCRRFSKSGYEEANQYEEDLSLHMGYCSEWKRGIQGCRFCSFGERREGE